MGANHGADVAAVQHGTADIAGRVGGKFTLIVQQGLAHFGNGGDFGGGIGYFRGAQRGVGQKLRRQVAANDIDSHGNLAPVGGVAAGLQRGQSYGTVECAGIQIGIAQTLRQTAGEGAFAGGRRAVYGDHNFLLGGALAFGELLFLWRLLGNKIGFAERCAEHMYKIPLRMETKLVNPLVK